MSQRNQIAVLLGEHLSKHRVSAGFPTQTALAEALNVGRSVINRIENGDRLPNPGFLSSWLDACHVTGQLRAMFEGVARVARVKENPGQEHTAPWFETEARGHTLRYWAPMIVPGIAQTSAYARELFHAMGLDDTTMEEFLADRMSRQEILMQPDAPDVTMVLWEPVLFHHQIGTRETMRDQMLYLVELSKLPTVAVHVLPSRLGANAGLGGAINLAAVDDAPELLLSDGLVADQLSTDLAYVRRARATFGRVRADALPRVESQLILMEASETWTD